MKKNGIVTAVDGEWAFVFLKRESPCDGCKKNCASCANTVTDSEVKNSSTAFSKRLKNNIGAKKGDEVVVEISSRLVVFFCVLLFLVPPLMSIGLYVLTARVFDMTQGVSAIVTFAFLIISYICIYLLAGKRIIKSGESSSLIGFSERGYSDFK